MPMRLICVVPARLRSMRFPGKLASLLRGTPVLIRTLQRASAADCFDSVICLTEDQALADLATDFGFKAELTEAAANGTERIAKAMNRIGRHFIVNLQGDEPLFPIPALRKMAEGLLQNPSSVAIALHDRRPTQFEIENRDRVKAVLDSQGALIDFRREVLDLPAERLRLQMGAYGYGPAFLASYANSEPSLREVRESHEMLRDPRLAPWNPVFCHGQSQGIDSPADLERAGYLLDAAVCEENPQLVMDASRPDLVN